MREILNRLCDVLSVQSKSRREDEMVLYILSQLPKDALYSIDKSNNVYVTKGKADAYPCVVAHTDTVHDIIKDVDRLGIWSIRENYFAMHEMRQVGIGGDDKVGIWIALECLRLFDNIKCAFFTGEEIGCVGSKAADMKFFEDVGYVLQADRRGANDAVFRIGGQDIASKDFREAVMEIGKPIGRVEAHGMMTDVEQLSKNKIGVSCMNMSCGYYDPHTDHEYVSEKDAWNTLTFVKLIIATLGERKFPHKYEGYTTVWANDYEWKGGWGWTEKEKNKNICKCCNSEKKIIEKKKEKYCPKCDVALKPSPDCVCAKCNSSVYQIYFNKGWYFCEGCKKPVNKVKDIETITKQIKGS